MTSPVIRPASDSDIGALQDIERSAGELFRDIGMAAIADDEPPAAAELRRYIAAGRAWVVELDGPPVGYLILDIVDGTAHIEQVSVRSGFTGQGLGGLLIRHAIAWAEEHRYPSVTLTTFTEVPWNGPYYRRLGFAPLADDQVTPELRTIREHEAAHGLDRWPRECLRLSLGPAPGAH